MTALAQIDVKIDRIAAAGAEKNRRHARRVARAVGADQHVGLEQTVAMRGADLAQARRTDLFGHFDENFAVEAERAAFGHHRLERTEIDAVLALIVGGAAAVDTVALDCDVPGRQPAPPQIVETTYRVAVAIQQYREQARIFDALGDKRRRTLRIVHDPAAKAEPSQRRGDLIRPIRTQRAGALRLLAARRDGDAPRQIGEEIALVEIRVRASDGIGAAHGTLLTWQIAGTPAAAR